MPTNCGVYQIVHKRTGQRYIGSSHNLIGRKKQHFRFGHWNCWSAKSRKKMKFTNSSTNQFHWGILEYHPEKISLKKLRSLEKRWIKLLPEENLLNATVYN